MLLPRLTAQADQELLALTEEPSFVRMCFAATDENNKLMVLCGRGSSGFGHQNRRRSTESSEDERTGSRHTPSRAVNRRASKFPHLNLSILGYQHSDQS